MVMNGPHEEIIKYCKKYNINANDDDYIKTKEKCNPNIKLYDDKFDNILCLRLNFNTNKNYFVNIPFVVDTSILGNESIILGILGYTILCDNLQVDVDLNYTFISINNKRISVIISKELNCNIITAKGFYQYLNGIFEKN